MAIYGYCRVSTASQADDGESLGVQERQIQGWCMMRGSEAEAILVERGVSGSVPVLKRPEGSKLWKLARKGDVIVCSRLDRLFRSSLDALQTCGEMQRRGVEVHVIEGLGNITTNGMGKAFMTIAATFAELERDTIRERISTVKADQKGRGRYLGGKVQFGWRVEREADQAGGQLIPVPEEQQIIAQAAQLRDKGQPLRTIQAEISQAHGRTLSLATLSKIVRGNEARAQ